MTKGVILKDYSKLDKETDEMLIDIKNEKNVIIRCIKIFKTKKLLKRMFYLTESYEHLILAERYYKKGKRA